MPKTNQQRQADFYTRQKERGLILKSVWIPKERADDLIRMAREWRGDQTPKVRCPECNSELDD